MAHTKCVRCGTPQKSPTGKIWLSEEGFCSVCYHNKYSKKIIRDNKERSKK